ncbi:SWIM zinc finger family protein [Streptomyces sp. NPDC101152]|uniref:SWIM zinc finger family protein n=1 Tax=Streptomyces sp. NPDC101152 TaxID=3366116 RepID=UPI00382DB21C
MSPSIPGPRRAPTRGKRAFAALTDAQWNTLLDTIAAQAGHLAALLDGEMPAELVDDARVAGVPLLPQPTELDPECSCPDWGSPCKHAAALCYAIASTIDADPFVVFALRGRGREETLAQLRARRMAARRPPPHRPQPAPRQPAPTQPGPPWPTPLRPCPNSPNQPPTPPHRPPLRHPAPVCPLGTSNTSWRTPLRAARLLTGDTTSLHLSQRQDAARIAASNCEPEWIHHLIHNTGTKPTAFARLTPGPVTALTSVWQQTER